MAYNMLNSAAHGQRGREEGAPRPAPPRPDLPCLVNDISPIRCLCTWWVPSHFGDEGSAVQSTDDVQWMLWGSNSYPGSLPEYEISFSFLKTPLNSKMSIVLREVFCYIHICLLSSSLTLKSQVHPYRNPIPSTYFSLLYLSHPIYPLISPSLSFHDTSISSRLWFIWRAHVKFVIVFCSSQMLST